MTDPRKLVTSLDVSRKVAEVLGYDVETYFSWQVRHNEYDDDMPEYDAWSLIGGIKINFYGDVVLQRIPAYTVTELYHMIAPQQDYPLENDPDDAALEVLADIAEKMLDENTNVTVESCLRNLREWQATPDES